MIQLTPYFVIPIAPSESFSLQDSYNQGPTNKSVFEMESPCNSPGHSPSNSPCSSPRISSRSPPMTFNLVTTKSQQGLGAAPSKSQSHSTARRLSSLGSNGGSQYEELESAI